MKLATARYRTSYAKSSATLSGRRRTAPLLLAASVGLSAGFIPQANAGFNVGGFVNDLSTCATGINCNFSNSGSEVSQTAGAVNAGLQALPAGIMHMYQTCSGLPTSSNNCFDGATSALGHVAGAALGNKLGDKAEEFVYTVRDMMFGMMTFFKDMPSELSEEFFNLAKAIVAGDEDDIHQQLSSILTYIQSQPHLKSAFETVLMNLKDEGAGSFLLMFSGDASFIASIEGGVGIAIDLDYLIDRFSSANGTATVYKNIYQDQGTNPIMSTFGFVGLAVGFSKGASLDLSFGYHTSNPTGVGGPGIDIGVEVAGNYGMGLAVGFDATQVADANPVPVAIATSVSAGSEVEASVGFSYVDIWHQLYSSEGVVTVSQHCSHGGYSKPLPVGSYTLSTLRARGIINDDLSSIQVESGYEAVLYQHDNYQGNSIVLSEDDSCLVDNGFNDAVSSIIVRETESQDSQTLAAALDCVAHQYARPGNCNWDNWSELNETCRTSEVPELHSDDFLLDKVKAGQCTWTNWSNLHDQIRGRTLNL